MSQPSIRALPLLGSVNHARIRKSVVFPAPLAPTSAPRSPLSTTRSMPRRTLLRSKLFFRPAIASKGVSTLFIHRSTNEICVGSPGGRNSLRPYSRRHLFAHQRAQLCFELCPTLLVYSFLYLTSFIRFIKLQQFLQKRLLALPCFITLPYRGSFVLALYLDRLFCPRLPSLLFGRQRGLAAHGSINHPCNREYSSHDEQHDHEPGYSWIRGGSSRRTRDKWGRRQAGKLNVNFFSGEQRLCL